MQKNRESGGRITAFHDTSVSQEQNRTYSEDNNDETQMGNSDRRLGMQPVDIGVEASGRGESLRRNARDVEAGRRSAGDYGEVSNRDSEGRALDERTLKALSGTAVADDSGRPIADIIFGRKSKYLWQAFFGSVC